MSGILDLLRTLFSHRRVQPRTSLPIANQEFAVIGLGRFGTSVALTLVERGHTVLGVDTDPARVQELADEITQTVALDSRDEDALRDIDITSYETVVVAIGSQFEANIMTTVALRSLGVRNIICKAATIQQRDILLKIGAHRVVLPEHESGRRIAQELSTPGILDQITLSQSTRVSELRCPVRYEGKTLQQVNFTGKYNVHVVAVMRGEDIHPCPQSHYTLTKEDLLVVIGDEQQIVRLLMS